MLVPALAAAVLAAAPALAGDPSPVAAAPAPADERSAGGLQGSGGGCRRDFGRLVPGGAVGHGRTAVTVPDGTGGDNVPHAGAEAGRG